MKHLAVIMDGNGRYAEQRGLERKQGHFMGAEAFVTLVRDFPLLPLKIITVYAFSTENYKRPKDEVNSILKIIATFLENKVYKIARENNITVKFIGDINSLPEYFHKIIVSAPVFDSDSKIIVIALNYGGLDEVCRAVNKIQAKKINFITEETIKDNLDTCGLPFPDAVLRYGGEKRLSNFLPLQTIYSELFFINKFWPEYDKSDILFIIEQFGKIKRKFGGLND